MEIVSADPEEQFLLELPPSLGKQIRQALKAGQVPPDIRIVSKSREPGAPLPAGSDPSDPPPVFDVIISDHVSGSTHSMDAEFVKLPTVVESFKSSDEKHFFKSGSLAGVIRATSLQSTQASEASSRHRGRAGASATVVQENDEDSSDDDTGTGRKATAEEQEPPIQLAKLTRSGRRTNVLPSGITAAADGIVAKHYRRHRRAMLQGVTIPEVSAIERFMVAMPPGDSTSLNLASEHESLVLEESWMTDLPDEYELVYENGSLIQATQLSQQAAARVLAASAPNAGAASPLPASMSSSSSSSTSVLPPPTSTSGAIVASDTTASSSLASVEASLPAATAFVPVPPPTGTTTAIASAPPVAPTALLAPASETIPASIALPAPASAAIPASTVQSATATTTADKPTPSSSSSPSPPTTSAASDAAGGNSASVADASASSASTDPEASSKIAAIASLKKEVDLALAQTAKLKTQMLAQPNPIQRRRLKQGYVKAQTKAKMLHEKLKALKAASKSV